MVPNYSEIFFSRFGGPILAERLTSGLQGPDRQRLRTIMSSRHYEKGQIIFSKDLVPREIVVLASGSAELKCGDTAGDRRKVMPGEVFGLSETLAEAKYCDSLMALSDCEINVIGRDELITYLRSTPEACYRSLEVIAENLHLARDRAVGDH